MPLTRRLRSHSRCPLDGAVTPGISGGIYPGGWSSGGLCPCARVPVDRGCARVPVCPWIGVVPGCPCARVPVCPGARASDKSRSSEVTRWQAVAVCLLIPQTVCPH